MRRDDKGFTLLEVMVASVIGAFIALVAVGTLRTVVAAKERVEKNTTLADELRFAANMIRNDLGNIYRDRDSGHVRLVGEIEEGENGLVMSLTMRTVGTAKARRDEPESDVYEVQYYLRKDKDKSALMRRVCPVAGDEDKSETAGGMLTAIAENIVGFSVLYYDGEEWMPEWTENMQRLPGLVDVSLVGAESVKEEQEAKARQTVKSFVVSFPRFPEASKKETTEAVETAGATQGTEDAGQKREREK